LTRPQVWSNIEFMKQIQDYTGVRLPKELKRKIRILAADRGVSLAVLSGELIELGLVDYINNKKSIPESAQGRELADFVTSHSAEAVR